MSPVTAEQQYKNTLLFDDQSELDHRQPCKGRVCLLAIRIMAVVTMYFVASVKCPTDVQKGLAKLETSLDCSLKTRKSGCLSFKMLFLLSP